MMPRSLLSRKGTHKIRGNKTGLAIMCLCAQLLRRGEAVKGKSHHTKNSCNTKYIIFFDCRLTFTVVYSIVRCI